MIGRSASQVLQDDKPLNNVKLWVHSVKTMGRSSKVADSSEDTNETISKERSKYSSQKWMLWKRFFRKEADLLTKEEIAERRKLVQLRRNAALFVPDYDEERTVSANNQNTSLEICDVEDSGHFDMKDDAK